MILDLDLGDVGQARRGVALHRGADGGVGAAAVPPVPGGLAGAHVRGVVDAGDPAARLHVADDRRALRVAPERTGRAGRRVQEQDRVVLRKVRGGEDARVLVRVVAVVGGTAKPVAVLPSDRVVGRLEGVLDNGTAVVDRVGMTEAGGAGVEQHPRVLVLRMSRWRSPETCENEAQHYEGAPHAHHEQAPVDHHDLLPGQGFRVPGLHQSSHTSSAIRNRNVPLA